MPARTNLCTNPALGTNATGWSGGSRVTDLLTPACPRATGYAVTASRAYTPNINVSGSNTYAFSFYFQATASGTVQSGVNWDGFFGGSSSTHTLSVTQGNTYRMAYTAGSSYWADGANLWVQGCPGKVSAVLIEDSSTVDIYFDGDTYGCSWNGTAENSASTMPSNVAQMLYPLGIPPNVFGVPVVANEPPKVIVPTGIASSFTSGTLTVVPGAVTIGPTSIASAGAFGNPRIVMGFLIYPVGIPSAGAFGTPTLVPGPVTIFPTGITSRLTFGTLSLVRLAYAIQTETKHKLTIGARYDMVVVNRIMQQQSKPVYIELDPLPWSGLSYTETLSAPTTLTAGIPISRITEPIKQVLKDMAHNACELWLYRNGKLIFTGPWLNWQIQNDTLTMNCKDTLGYLDWWWVMEDLVFAAKDQFLIGQTLIDKWQALDYGNFGIDTSGIGLSGVLRDATYLQIEGDQVSNMLNELGLRLNGFDVSIDPASRALKFHYPTRGIDRSSGDQAIVFDSRNVANTNVLCSAGPEDIVSEGIVVGTAAGSTDGPVYSTKSNLGLRAQFGRTGLFLSQDGVSDQTTADAYAQGIVDARSDALLLPGPDVHITPDVDLSLWDVGDTVAYQLHETLDITGNYRVLTRLVTVSDSGVETVTLTFV